MEALSSKHNDALNAAHQRLQDLYAYYSMGKGDYELMLSESPNLMSAIEAIEESHVLPYEEFKQILHKWIENYHLAFKRRKARKR